MGFINTPVFLPYIISNIISIHGYNLITRQYPRNFTILVQDNRLVIPPQGSLYGIQGTHVIIEIRLGLIIIGFAQYLHVSCLALGLDLLSLRIGLGHGFLHGLVSLVLNQGGLVFPVRWYTDSLLESGRSSFFVSTA